MSQEAIEVIDDYDVFVAGAGALGCTIAHYLVPELKVLIADAGVQLSKIPGEHQKNAYVFQKNIDAFTHVISGHLQPISVPLDTTWINSISPISFHKKPFLRNGQNLDQDVTVNLPGAFSTYAVGGMLTHWTCAIPRHHEELERKLNGEDYIDSKEWAVLYPEAEQLLCQNTGLFSGSVRDKVVLKALNNAYKGHLPEGHIQPLPVAAQLAFQDPESGWRRIKWTGADNILGTLATAPPSLQRFKILNEHVVRKVEWKKAPEGSKEPFVVDYAVVKDLATGRTKHVKAKYYVIAANAILTPQILWNSGIGKNADIKEDQGSVSDPANLPVGRYLTDQPMAFCQIILKDSLVEEAKRLAAERQKESNNQKYGYGGKVLAGDPTGMPINEPPPNLWIPCSADKYFYVDPVSGEKHEGPRQWHCQVHRDAFSYGAIPPNVDERLVVDLRWFGANRPEFNNRVTFNNVTVNPPHSTNTDLFGMPQPTFHYRIPEKDRIPMHAMMSDMLFAASALGGFFPGTEPKWMAPGLALHFQGTFRMGMENDGKHVADTNSRVFLFENLYVAGNGIIPTATSSNPTLTSCALAYKSCQSILKDAKHKGYTSHSSAEE